MFLCLTYLCRLSIALIFFVHYLQIDDDFSNYPKRLFLNKMFTTALALLSLVKLFLKTNFYAPKFPNSFLLKKSKHITEGINKHITHLSLDGDSIQATADYSSYGGSVMVWYKAPNPQAIFVISSKNNGHCQTRLHQVMQMQYISTVYFCFENI